MLRNVPAYMCAQLRLRSAFAFAQSLGTVLHYENTPIQIYRKFHLQKLKIFRLKTLLLFKFLLKTQIVGTR